jgi:hypothetical protein
MPSGSDSESDDEPDSEPDIESTTRRRFVDDAPLP